MSRCVECGEDLSMPYTCNYCGESYCSRHRLPENHSCGGLSSYEDEMKDSGKIYGGPSTSTASSSGGSKLSFSLGRFDGNVTFLLLILMVAVHVLQFLVLLTMGQNVHNAVFTLRPDYIPYLWTWLTSVFSHSPSTLIHILFNGIILFFFGTVLERKIGSKRFLGLFLVGGMLAGLAQASSTLALGGPGEIPILGASGAILAVMGTLTVLRPNLTVYLWFFLPMPLWFLTIAFAVYDLFFFGLGGPGAGGVARVAHLSGLAIGLVYGYKLKKEGVSMRSQIQLGGGGPGGPGGPGNRGPPRF